MPKETNELLLLKQAGSHDLTHLPELVARREGPHVRAGEVHRLVAAVDPHVVAVCGVKKGEGRWRRRIDKR